jgi:cytochrome c-type biogenesis protein
VAGTDYAIVFTAGVVSFASPCVLPLIPVYLSVATGLEVGALSGGGLRTSALVLRGAGLFALGFSVVFVALGLSATAVGSTLARHQVPITRVGGVVVLLLAGAMVLGTTRWNSVLGRERRFRPPTRESGWAAPVAGAAFAFGWTPCIGPVLGSVLAMAASQGAIVRGGALLATYSAGLAVPLLVTGAAFHRALGALRWTRRHVVVLTRTAAGLLAAYGLLLVTDRLAWLTAALQGGVAGPG